MSLYRRVRLAQMGGIFLRALFIWHVGIGNSDWVTKISTGTVSKIKNSGSDFNWSWGFRASLGLNMGYDQWYSDFYYTWFRSKHENLFQALSNEVASTPHDTEVPPTFISAKGWPKVSFLTCSIGS